MRPLLLPDRPHGHPFEAQPLGAPDASDAQGARCYALADHARVLIPDPAAFALGVHAGNARAHALALAPSLVLLEPDPARETRAFEALALALLAYTPKVSFAQSHTLLLEVGSGLRLFGGVRALLAKVAATVADCGHAARIACAPTAWGAWTLAQARATRASRRWRVLKETTLARVLDTLPVTLAPFAAQHDHALTQIGCASLGDLRRLSPALAIERPFVVWTWPFGPGSGTSMTDDQQRDLTPSDGLPVPQDRDVVVVGQRSRCAIGRHPGEVIDLIRILGRRRGRGSSG